MLKDNTEPMPPPKRKRGRTNKARPPAKPSRQLGRPTIYTPEIDEQICRRLAAGETLRAICRSPAMPAEPTVRGWARDPEHPFASRYDRARELGYQSMADELIDIADDSRNDWTDRETTDGKTTRVVDTEVVNRSRLRVDARKWLLSKALPKVYGDKIEMTGKDGGPIAVTLTHLERARRIALLFAESIENGGAPPALAGLLSKTPDAERG